MKSLVRAITAPVIRLIFRVSRSRQWSRPRVFSDGGKTRQQLLKELR